MKLVLSIFLFFNIFFITSATASEQVALNKKMREIYCSIIVKKARNMKLRSYSRASCLNKWNFHASQEYEPFPGPTTTYQINFSDSEIAELENLEQTLICDIEIKVFKKKVKITSAFCDIDG